MRRQEHWENVYRQKGDAELSWHQEEPGLSLALIRQFASPAMRIIDVGGGSSGLAGRLAAGGYDGVTVVDLSAAALERARERAGPAAERITWRVADATRAQDLGRFDVWHDRAVFHFLTEPADRQAYLDRARESIVSGGHLIVATFALDGPPKCSGLEVQRYDAAGLVAAFGEPFQLVYKTREVHTTPWGKPQAFTYAVLQRG